MDRRHPFFQDLYKIQRGLFGVCDMQLPYLHRVINLIIHLISVDVEVPLFRRSAALVKVVLPKVYSYRLV
jgi:hypothetical protein